MISATGDNHRHHYHHHQPQHPGAVDASRPPIAGDRVEPFSVKQEPFSVKQEPGSLPLLRGHDSNEVDEDFHLSLAHQMYKAGNYKKALEHSNTVYERNPLRTDNLLLLQLALISFIPFLYCVLSECYCL
ncbi:probable UDP-N-acetylglucosamine--peptide N-acetylglucosaminyltransferase SEC [Arachis duranensis]|uniref:Probable UDP-N-acetylglucosamine--peptide N-acetylglucosaminyltransferase SEC n=1 Tax=Arachis duranensis TaxID=130453 RepID=A0A9C6T9V1_ARADU|nr:probable UDP-N-acetylglucosamine--peptide N-acetylglucosaminyltransferase SEC [Arachis duranensis]